MAVVLWQVLVMISVCLGFVTGGRRLAFWIAVTWTIWTLIAIFLLPLVLIQLGTAWGSYLLCRWIASIKKSLSEERAKRDQIDEDFEAYKKQVADTIGIVDIKGEHAKFVSETFRRDPERIEIVVGSDHYRVLIESINNAQKRISILSGWIGSPLLDAEVQSAFSRAVVRGVQFRLGFGWESVAGHDLSPLGARALEFLKRLKIAAKEGQFDWVQFPNHAKILVCDDEYVVIGSNNWLSNKSFRNDERSALIRCSDAAQREHRTVDLRFTSFWV